GEPSGVGCATGAAAHWDGVPGLCAVSPYDRQAKYPIWPVSLAGGLAPYAPDRDVAAGGGRRHGWALSPPDLSGGQQQRVALARALAPAPQLLLLDEPFSNLDVHLRQQLREEVQAILVQAGITTILVTHEQEEAPSFADTLAVIDRGQVVQYAPPDEVVRRPRTRFVAQFIGLGHFLRGEIHEACITTELGEVPYTSARSLTGNGRQVDLLVRPEHVQLCNTPHGTPVQVVHISFRGARQLYTLRLPSGVTFCALFPSEI